MLEIATRYVDTAQTYALDWFLGERLMGISELGQVKDCFLCQLGM